MLLDCTKQLYVKWFLSFQTRRVAHRARSTPSVLRSWQQRSFVSGAAEVETNQEAEDTVFPTASSLPQNASSSELRPDLRPVKDQELELVCYALSTTGLGVCRTAESFVVFVPRAVPGESLRVKISSVDNRSARGEKLQTLTASQYAIEAPCPHFDVCGGCAHQHIAYAAQLEQKQNWAVEAMRRIGKIGNPEALMKPPIPCEKPYEYRNKMTFALNTQAAFLEQQHRQKLKDQPIVGLYRRSDPNEVFEVERCWLQDETANSILAMIKQYIPVIQAKGKLVIEKIVIRRGLKLKLKTSEHMVIFHTWNRPKPVPPTAEEAAEPFADLVERLVNDFPSVVSLYDCRAIQGREKAFPILNKLHGKEFLVHFAGSTPFHVDPLAFFQTNENQAGKLADMVYEAAELRTNDLLVDLYCGVGMLGVSAAARQQEKKKPLRLLYGYDIYNQAIQNARANSRISGLKHKTYQFRSGDLSQPTLGAPSEVDVIFADPGRAGLAESTRDYVLQSQARTFIYVSCSIATQARDIAFLTEARNERRFQLESVQICDMFPQTSHVESVAVLRRKNTTLPGYVRPALKRQRKKLKPQKIQKQIVPTADLPWIDGGNPELDRRSAKQGGRGKLDVLGTELPGSARHALVEEDAEYETEEASSFRNETGTSGRRDAADEAHFESQEPNRRARRDLLFGRTPKKEKPISPRRNSRPNWGQQRGSTSRRHEGDSSQASFENSKPLKRDWALGSGAKLSPWHGNPSRRQQERGSLARAQGRISSRDLPRSSSKPWGGPFPERTNTSTK